MADKNKKTGYASIDKPWMKYYSKNSIEAPLPECTIYEMLYKNNHCHLDDIAINYYDRKITYAELFENIEKTTKAFSALGICAGEIVIICSVNTPETVYALYALNRLGAIANMVDPRTNADGVHEYIKESNTRFIITVELAYPLIKKAAIETSVEKIISVSPADSLPQPKKFLYRLKTKQPELQKNAISWSSFIDLGYGTIPVCAPYQKGRCCVIAHTGGTTGVPKGVMLSDDNLNAVTHSYRQLGIPFERKHRYFNDLPPFIVYGLSISMHTVLCYGLEMILYPVFDSKGFPKLFAKYKPQHFSALPDHLKYLSTDKTTANMDLSFLISPGIGGDSLNVDLERSVNEYLSSHGCKYEVVKGYGMTELAATACLSFQEANDIGSVGIPLIVNTFKIVDTDTLEEVVYGEIGEIWISGPTVMQGYYNMPKETSEITVIDQNGTKWIRTGDLGYITEDGLIFHRGRLRRIYLTSFEGQPAKIFPMLVEDKLKNSAAVFDCVVVGRLKKNSANYESVAFVVLDDGYEPTEALKDELAQICIDNTPSYMWPVEYRFVTDLPHTPIGKVDFRALEKASTVDAN